MSNEIIKARHAMLFFIAIWAFSICIGICIIYFNNKKILTLEDTKLTEQEFSATVSNETVWNESIAMRMDCRYLGFEPVITAQTLEKAFEEVSIDFKNHTYKDTFLVVIELDKFQVSIRPDGTWRIKDYTEEKP